MVRPSERIRKPGTHRSFLLVSDCISYWVKHNQHAYSMLMLGMSGGIPAKKLLNNRCSEMNEGISVSKYFMMCITFKIQN